MIEIRIGDALDQLREMAAESVHCCVTSPPYWGLRDYGVDGQIGLEETPDEWCARLVEVFREVKRVLRTDGTCWVNVGDSYASNGYAGGQRNRDLVNGVSSWGARECSVAPTAGVGDLKPKDLIGQPWLLAFALRADGWFLRDAIVWNKPNPMPESVKDRCTNAYEHVFLLAKSSRYFFDAEAIRENHQTDGKLRGNGGNYPGTHQATHFNHPEGGRNCRNVWTIATEAFSEAHFATFPTELARRCILAGTSSKGVCADCGAPLDRIVERPQPPEVAPSSLDRYGTGKHGVHRKVGGQYQKWLDANPVETTGWQPSCKCDAEIIGGTVLDPFGGAGTTGLVADRLQRNAVLIELNAEYAAMAQRRIDTDRGNLFDIIEQPKPEQQVMALEAAP